MKFVKIFALIFLILILPFTQSASFGSGGFGLGLYSQGEEEENNSEQGDGNQVEGNNQVVSSGGGGGGSGLSVIPLQFDIKILDIELPLVLGQDFDFTYFIKGVGAFNHDVVLNFWIEKDGENVTSGSDVVFMGENEEKTESAKIFLPSSLESGIYTFNAKVSYNEVMAEAHRTIELVVGQDVVEVNELFDVGFSLEKNSIKSTKELVSVVNLENLGEDLASFQIKSSVLNEKGEIVYEEIQDYFVQDQEQIKKTFPDLNLKKGKYTFVLETVYNEEILDSFSQEFVIEKSGVSISEIFVDYFFGIILFLSLVVLVIYIVFRRNHHKKSRKISKPRKKLSKKHKNNKVENKHGIKKVHEKIDREVENL